MAVWRCIRGHWIWIRCCALERGSAAPTRAPRNPIPRLSGEKAIDNIGGMKNKSIGMILLAVFLIFDGLLGFGLNVGPAVFLLYIVALAAGVFILIGK